MKTFSCDKCGSLVFFENVKCLSCGHVLGFLPSSVELAAFEPADTGAWRRLSAGSDGSLYRRCKNGQDFEVCNWMIPAGEQEPLCVSCRLNEIIPNLSDPANTQRWHKLELAKRRVIYTVLRLGLPIEKDNGHFPLRFSFTGGAGNGPAPVTGHLNGLITVNIAEADDAECERLRVNLHEPYRTLLGHFRHEIAHYYWDRLIAQSPSLPGFRALFGDDSQNYGAAIKSYYDKGPPPDWQTRHVSAYASSHPWEDWAETWAHYFHIMDMVETADGFGMTLSPKHPAAQSMSVPKGGFNWNAPFDAIIARWFPLTYALNSLNRGMGLPDAYPFALSSTALEKLAFIHKLIVG